MVFYEYCNINYSKVSTQKRQLCSSYIERPWIITQRVNVNKTSHVLKISILQIMSIGMLINDKQKTGKKCYYNQF